MPVLRKRSRFRPRGDWGRGLSLVLCVLFAVVGAIPLALGLLVRTRPVKEWAARETSEMLARELGITARYEVSVQAWPLTFSLEDLVVDASDGGSPFLEVERVAVKPRAFSLLAGELDAGDVEIVGPRIRAVVTAGQLTNLRYKLPDVEGGTSQGPRRAPITSLEITDAHLEAMVDGDRVATREVDVDVSAEEGGAFEVSLRAGPTEITRTRAVPGRPDEDAVDEDRICRVDTRVRIEDGGVLLIRRLTLIGSSDFDPDPGTMPSCELGASDWRRVEIRLGALRIGPIVPGLVPPVSGRVYARVPAALAHRAVAIPHATGSITLDADVDFDGKARLPRVNGHLHADVPGIDGKIFAEQLDAEVEVGGDVVRVSKLLAIWGDGEVRIAEARLAPFEEGMPLTAGPIDLDSMELPGLLRDLAIHPRTHVAMSMKHGRFERFGGTLDPVDIRGLFAAQVQNFEVYDRPTVEPARGHMVGVKEATLRGTFGIRDGPAAPLVVFEGFSVDTPRGSHLRTTVILDLREIADIEVFEGSHVDLADISPLVTVPIGGQLTITAKSRAPFEAPDIKGEIAIKDFVFAGMPVGELEHAKAHFAPLVLTLADARVKHGTSRVRSNQLRIAFDEGPDVVVEGDVDTREPPHLGLHDFFETFGFVSKRGEKLVWTDPRWAEISGTAIGTGRLRFVLGGKEDRCGGGYLDVRSQMRLKGARIFGEGYDEVAADADFVWDDQLAGADGMRLDIRSASLRKGTGTILASGTVRHGGVVRVDAIATGVPIGELDAFGPAGKLFDGNVSMVAAVSGTLGAMQMSGDVQVSRVRIGPESLPPSRFKLAMLPAVTPPRSHGLTACGNRKSGAGGYDWSEHEKDRSAGIFRANGQLFDGQITLDDVELTQQRHKVLSGTIGAKDLDLGKLANLVPGVAFAGKAPQGKLTGTAVVKRLPLDQPRRGEVVVTLTDLAVERAGYGVKLLGQTGAIRLADDELTVPEMRLEARTSSGLAATLAVGGEVHRMTSAPDLDLSVRVEPLELSRLSADLAQVSRATGVADATLQITGPPGAPRYKGSAHIRNGEVDLEDPAITASAITVDVDIGGGEVRVTRATANIGGGTVAITARMPVRGLELGTATATIAARGVRVPVADGVNLTTNADLEATFRPGDDKKEKNLPTIEGTVELTSFTYTRPIAMSVNLGQLTGKSQRTSVDAYNPEDEVVRFDVNVVSPRPLRFANNLVTMQLQVVDPGLQISGTNERYGARGMLKILPESRLQLRANEFEVREGWVRFDDASRIAPKVDVRAQTEYRRYASTASEGGDAAAAASTSSASANTSGQWRINLHAHGDVDDLKMNLTSDPALGQDDILLLLTLGMTRAEIDRGLASSLGETVGLEALSALTGADKAVKTIVPLIDEFRFGTAYSSRTGRTEPTVTLGKRITDDVRANVTTGITENREVRSSVEWRLNRRVSVQGSYDNANDASSSSVGNVGADLRWRLEFE